MDILYHNELDIKSLGSKFDQTLEHLRNGNFAAAEAKKMSETNLYRAKLDYSSRLIFRFAKYNGHTYLLLLEIIQNHDYSKSRFLRGVPVDENKLLPLTALSEVDSGKMLPLSYLNAQHKHFHFLGKIISFDSEQAEIFHLLPPLIIIGSAGSGKTALALEKIKSLSGNILYVTLSPFLAEHASHLYYSGHYENEAQEIDFLSFREFVEAIRIPEGEKIGFREFEKWFFPHRHHAGIKDAHKLFEEFSGVLTGHSVEKEFLSRDEYLRLGVRQSIFLSEERNRVYDLFEKYLRFLNERKYYDINIIAHHWLKFCRTAYDFIIVDEVQDYTNIQLYLILRSLKRTGNFILCGDSNQIVHPNFFSWGKVKTMFHDHLPQNNVTRILTTNYRNSPQVTNIANRLLKIKNARFGSIDRESTYLIRSIASVDGEVSLLYDTEEVKAELNRKTRQSARFAVLVMRTEDKAVAAKYFNTPLIFSVQEAKGLEYENILLVNFISENAQPFRDISSGLTLRDIDDDKLTYSRASDKTDKSLEAYKFFINALFVALTRSTRNLYIIEKNHRHELLALLELNVTERQINLQEQVSSKDEWQREAQRLEKQGRAEQAELIHKTILGTRPVPWQVITPEALATLKTEALNPEIFNKKAKDLLFNYALIYNDTGIMLELIRFNYRRAEQFDAERSSLLRRVFVDYASDAPQRIMPLISKYGADFRNEYNQTPLMIAVWTGSVNIANYLLTLGAKTELTDNLGKNALRTAFLQTHLAADYAKTKFGKIYPLVVTESVNVKTENRLVKINNHKSEYQLLNLLMATQKELIASGKMGRALGFTSGEIAGIFENYPDNVLPPYRKKQQYISAVLARNEVSKEEYAYNRKLFLRLERGYYVINPELEIQVNNRWLNVYELMRTEKITQQYNSDMMRIRTENYLKLCNEREMQLLKFLKKETGKNNPNYYKVDEMERALKTARKERDQLHRKIHEAEKEKTSAGAKK